MKHNYKIINIQTWLFNNIVVAIVQQDLTICSGAFCPVLFTPKYPAAQFYSLHSMLVASCGYLKWTYIK